MKNVSKLFIIFTLISINISCSKKIEDNNVSQSPENLYKLAMIDLDSENYESAKKQFELIEFNFPLSNEAVQSKLMIAFIDYANMNYEEAIYKFNRFINVYPAHKNIDYAFYMRAMCYYEQIENEFLDGNNNIKALENFNQIVNRFPNSKYSRDSEQKIILIKENIAAKHMDIAYFYLEQKKYLAAMKRYQIIIDEYSQSKFTPEALHRLVEIYFALGMKEDSIKTASVLGYNYPDSKWYKYSYNLVGPKDNKNKKSFFGKVFNLLNKENEKE